MVDGQTSFEITGVNFNLRKIAVAHDRIGTIPALSKVVTAYIWRAFGKRPFAKKLRVIGGKDLAFTEDLLKFKLHLENCLYRNRLLMACKEAIYNQAKDIESIASDHQIHLADLEWMLDTHPRDFYLSVKHKAQQKLYTDEDITFVVQKLTPLIKRRVHTDLRFIHKYSPNTSFDDMVADLVAIVVYFIREYEVNIENDEHLQRTINQGVRSYIINWQKAFGNPKHQVIRRVHKPKEYKKVWVIDSQNKVKRAKLYAKNKKVSSNVLHLRCVFKDTSEAFVPAHNLFDSKEDAIRNKKNRQRQKDPTFRDRPYIDFNAQDEPVYQTTSISLFQPVKTSHNKEDSQARIIDFVNTSGSFDPIQSDAVLFLEEFSHVATERLRQFAELVFAPSPSFQAWLEKNGLDYATLSNRELTRGICKYLNTSLTDIKQDFMKCYMPLMESHSLPNVVIPL